MFVYLQTTAGFLSKFLKYNNMAANRNNFLTFFFSERRNLLGALLFIWLFHFVFNFELWFADKNRLFPMLPAGTADFTLPDWLRYFFILNIILSLAAACWRKEAQKVAFGSYFISFLLLIAEDVLRLQPYYYFYTWVFFLLVFSPGTAILRLSLRILAGACYFWGGIFKFNEWYLSGMKNVFLRINETFFNNFFTNFFIEILWIIPVWEVLLGISLLNIFSKISKTSLYSALFLHFCIILTLFAASWNRVVVPWNVLIALTVLFAYFFEQEECEQEKQILAGKFSYFIPFILAFFALFAPVGNYFGFWDTYLSWKVYTGDAERFRLEAEEFPQIKSLPALRYDKASQKSYVLLNEWLPSETRTLFYPEKRYFLLLKKKLAEEREKNKKW